MFSLNGRSTLGLAAILILFRFLPLQQQTVKITQIQPGKDPYPNDMYGTEFLVPRPLCRTGSLYKLQLLPRAFDPVIVAFNVFNGNGYIGDLRNGNSSTVYIPCSTDWIEYGKSRGAFPVTATNLILVYLLSDTDALPVPPLNAMATNFTVLQVPHPDYDFSFLAVTSDKDAAIDITYQNGSMAQIWTVAFTTCYINTSTGQTTGMTLVASQPIFLVVGMYDSTRPRWESTLMEFVRPEKAWGKHYVLTMPSDSSDYDLRMVAYALEPDQRLTLSVDKFTAQVNADGTVVNLNYMKKGDKRVVTVSSNGSRFGLLFLLISPTYYQLLHSTRFIRFRVKSLLFVTPVEQYTNDPCLFYQLNTMSKTTVMAGAADRGPDSDNLKPLQGSSRLALGKYWVRVFDNTLPRDLGTLLNKTTGAETHRLWFHDFSAIRRYSSAYFLNGGGLLRPLTASSNCTPGEADDDIDNDCDGLLDEEIIDGQDDDGDGQVDEDTSALSPYDCRNTIKPYTWEPTRYRLTRFEFRNYDYAHRLPPGYPFMVLVSALVGVALVFIFIFVIWVFDRIEYYRDPYAIPKIFY